MRIGFALLVLAVSAGQVQGQGTVNFRTTVTPGPPAVDTRVRDCDGSLMRLERGLRAELMYAPDGLSDSEFMTAAVRLGADVPVGLPAAGVISGGNRTAPTQTPGGFGLFQVRVWDPAYGPDWAAVMRTGNPRAIVIESRIMRVDTASPLPPAETPVDLPLLDRELTYHPVGGFICVPEPSIIALGALGLGVLVLLRRRK